MFSNVGAKMYGKTNKPPSGAAMESTAADAGNVAGEHVTDDGQSVSLNERGSLESSTTDSSEPDNPNQLFAPAKQTSADHGALPV